LTDLGIDMAVFELEHEGDPRWMNLKNSAQMESDSDWEETLAWVDMQLSKRDKASSDEWLKNNPIEEIEGVADEVVELPALEVAFEKLDKVAQEQEESYKELQGSPTPTEFSGIFPEPSVVVGHGFGKDAHISVYGTNDIQEVQFDNTWNGVNKLFEKIHYSDSGFSNNEDAVEMRKLIFEYLEKHFNVPTLKQ
jgi:hypothetical protein